MDVTLRGNTCQERFRLVCSYNFCLCGFQISPLPGQTFQIRTQYLVLHKFFEVHSLESASRYSGVLSGFRILHSYNPSLQTVYRTLNAPSATIQNVGVNHRALGRDMGKNVCLPGGKVGRL